MAYNSDGYIMLDFTEVDFRRTNQTIEGLYKRCVDVIGTNKFILVINANGRTPLPATCSFTNNQYVIDTCIYMFAISSNDNLFIRRNDVPASDIIDDSSISVDKTWSSLNTVEKLAPIDTVIGNPATFNTSLELPLIACKVSFSATQAGSGTPSPDNVRTISGYSAIGVAHSNRNILPYTLEDIISANGGQSTWTDNTKTINGLTFTLNTDSDGKLTSITIKNTATYNTAFYLHSRFTSIYFPDSTLYSGVSSAVAGYSARISHSGGQIISLTTAAVAKKTYSNCDIILFFNSGNTFDITVSPRLILSGESDNSYVPHEGTYTTIQIGSTVYGGEYDAKTGVLTATDKIIDLGNLSWSASGSNFVSPYFNLIDTNIKPPATNNDTLNGMCEVLNLTSYNSLSDKCIALSSGKNLFARNSDYIDANDFKNSVTGYYLKYPLATPTTIQLSPTQLSSIIGNNTFFTDGDTLTVSYRHLPIDLI